MACEEMEEATALSPLGEDCSGGAQAGGDLCWSVCTAQHGTMLGAIWEP